MKLDIIHNQDCLEGMGELPDGSIDLIACDPPYSIGFMGKKWDQALPSVDIWREALRVLKPGAFAFVMCIPRQDCLARMVVALEEAGFNVSFTSIYWAYASGFPKAQNIGKAVDKRNAVLPDIARKIAIYIGQECKKKFTNEELSKLLGRSEKSIFIHHWVNGNYIPRFDELKVMSKYIAIPSKFKRDWKLLEEEAKREIIGKRDNGIGSDSGSGCYSWNSGKSQQSNQVDITLPATPQAQALDGSYSYNPKPAVECILVCQKPMRHKTFVDQALAWHQQNEEVKQGKRGATDIAPGCVNFDDCRVPYESSKDKRIAELKNQGNALKNRGKLYGGYGDLDPNWQKQARFPANLLASDDALNDGDIRKSGKNRSAFPKMKNQWLGESYYPPELNYGDSGSFSRYFSLDTWFAKKLAELPKGVQRTFPFLIVPKASKAEKNRGCEGLEEKERRTMGCGLTGLSGDRTGRIDRAKPMEAGSNKLKNYHPTCKPIKLMSYLITLGSRPGDVVLDPFLGSGTTAIAARMLRRRYIGYETDPDYCRIAEARLSAVQERLI